MNNCPTKVFFLICITYLNTALSGTPVFASSEKRGDLALAVIGGAPELVGLQISVPVASWLLLGAGFGSLPINSYLQQAVPVSSVPVPISYGGPYSLYPAAQFSLTSFSVFIRAYPLGRGLFFQLGETTLTASASVNGNLKNESSGGTAYGVLSGSATLSQPVADLHIGYELSITRGLFVQAALGVCRLLKTNYTINLGGTVAALVPLDPNADQAFSSAKDLIQTQIDGGMQKYRDAIQFLPEIFLGIGWAFDLSYQALDIGSELALNQMPDFLPVFLKVNHVFA